MKNDSMGGGIDNIEEDKGHKSKNLLDRKNKLRRTECRNVSFCSRENIFRLYSNES